MEQWTSSEVVDWFRTEAAEWQNEVEHTLEAYGIDGHDLQQLDSKTLSVMGITELSIPLLLSGLNRVETDFGFQFPLNLSPLLLLKISQVDHGKPHPHKRHHPSLFSLSESRICTYRAKKIISPI